MHTFKYRARENTGDTTEGTIEAQSREDAIEKISQMDCFPVKVEKVFIKSEPSSSGSFYGKIRSRDITTFSRQLLSIRR